jgi:hypothetical protein
MSETSLARAIERFASLTQDLPDSALELEWAWGAYDSEGVRFAFFRTYEELRELAARTAAERVAHGLPASSAQRILAQYHESYRDLQAALLGLGADEADRAPAEGEWSPRRVVAHIAGAELGFYGVIRYKLDGHRSGDGQPDEIPDEAWDNLIGEDEATTVATLDGPLDALQSYLTAHHQRVLAEFATITDDELDLPSLYWEGQELSLRFRLHRFDSHLRQHTVQIDKALQDMGQAPREAQRLLRLVFAALAEAEGATIGAPDVGAELWQETAEPIAARTEEIAAILAEA